jgi:predicted Zn finger-like uncharacterized protein
VLTQCPSCQTVFRITGTILRAAHGQVRCGRCDTQFDAINQLLDGEDGHTTATQTPLKPPTEAYSSDNDNYSSSAVAHEDIVMEGNRIEISGIYPRGNDAMDDMDFSATQTTIEEFNLDQDEWDAARANSTAESIDDQAVADAELDDVETALSETELLGALSRLDESRAVDQPIEEPDRIVTTAARLRSDHQTSSLAEINPWLQATSNDAAEPMIELTFTAPSEPRRWPWLAASVLLGLGLGAQLLHHYRQALARHPSIGSEITRLYAALGQPLPPQWDLNFYSIKQWGIVSDPLNAGILRVRASVTNRAAYAQPYPLLQLSLEDRFGSNVGSRAFKPDEYLGSNAQATRLLAAGESANIDLAIVDPGQDAVGFQFDTCLALTTGLRCTHASGG